MRRRYLPGDDTVGRLPHVELLVEMHGHFGPGVMDRPRHRFASTHLQGVIGYEETASDVALYLYLARVSFLHPMLAYVVNEYRDADMV